MRIHRRLPTPIQAESVPLILGGGDVMAAAETGSGKTGAFALPVIQIVHETLVRRSRGGDSDDAAAADLDGVASCRLNVDDRDDVVAISADGLTCQARAEHAWGGCRANVGAFSGKVYFESTVSDEGLCRIGWATSSASLDIGTDKFSFGFGGTGKKSHAKQFQDYGEAFGLRDTIGCWLDLASGDVGFTKNSVDLGVAFTLPSHLRGQPLFPAVSLKNAELVMNFGGTPFAHGPPEGFIGLAASQPDAVATWAQMQAAAVSMTGPGGRKPLALVLEPARDLAEQTHENMAAFSRHFASPEVKCEALVGGVSAAAQIKALKGGVDVVTGTPGRVIDLVERGDLSIDGVKFFVLDEADRLLDTGNRDTIMKLFRQLPKVGAGANRLQVLLFSATLHSPEIRALSQKICQNPVLVDLKGRDAVPDTVDHAVVVIDPREDRTWLQSEPRVWTDGVHAPDAELQASSASPEAWSEALKRLKPRLLRRLVDTLKMEQALIFCRTNFDCDNLEKFLNSLETSVEDAAGASGKRKRGPGPSAYSCVVLAGARSMDERRAALQSFKDGEVRFLIATDVAARGIDIQGLPFVINMTLPDRSEDYIHRIGRVGRADAIGLAVSLVAAVPEKVWYCTQKGLKPWLNPTKANTALNEKGGHTVWYDEPALLRDVEKRLGSGVAVLPADLTLPTQIASRVGGQAGQRYGQAQGTETFAKEVAARAAAVRPTLVELDGLEHKAQQSFFALKKKWAPAE